MKKAFFWLFAVIALYLVAYCHGRGVKPEFNMKWIQTSTDTYPAAKSIAYFSNPEGF